MPDDQAQPTFDRFHASVEGLPDVKSTKPSAVKQALPLVGNVLTTTVQTFRSKDFGFAIAITVVDADGTSQFVLPDKVASAIYRQRQSLTDRSTPASRARQKRRREREKRKRERERRRAQREGS